MQTKQFTLLVLSGRDVSQKDIAALAGNGRTLEYALTYTPPYESFHGLRRLLLAIRKMGPFPPAALVIDLTEWVGHESEEYFDAAVRYFHDHAASWNLIFLVRESDRRTCRDLYLRLRLFLSGDLREDPTFADAERLAEYLFANADIDAEGADLLAELLLSPEAEPLRSYPLLDSFLCELEENGTITAQSIHASLNDPTSLLGLLFEDVS